MSANSIGEHLLILRPDAGAHLGEIRETCTAALDILKARIAAFDLPPLTFAQAQLEWACLKPGAAAEYERQRPGFTLMYWLHALQCEIGADAADEHLQGILDQFCNLITLNTKLPN